MYLIESILAGAWATLVMDSQAKLFASKKLLYAFVTPEEIGRWFVYSLKGKMYHKDIREAAPIKSEIKWYYFSHYIIGIFLAGFYLLLATWFDGAGEQNWMALVFGILTVIFPWFWFISMVCFVS